MKATSSKKIERFEDFSELDPGLKEALRSERPVIRIDPEVAGDVFTPKKNEICKLLREKGPLHIKEIAEETDRKHSAVSRDLNVLEFAGIVEKEKEGRKTKVKYVDSKIIIE